MKRLPTRSAGLLTGSILTTLTWAGGAPAEAKVRTPFVSAEEVRKAFEAVKIRSNTTIMEGFTPPSASEAIKKAMGNGKAALTAPTPSSGPEEKKEEKKPEPEATPPAPEKTQPENPKKEEKAETPEKPAVVKAPAPPERPKAEPRKSAPKPSRIASDNAKRDNEDATSPWESRPQFGREGEAAGGEETPDAPDASTGADEELSVETFDNNFPGVEVGGSAQEPPPGIPAPDVASQITPQITPRGPIIPDRTPNFVTREFTAPERPTVTVPAMPISEMERLLFERVNQERAQRSMPGLMRDRSLSAVARRHSLDMARRNYFSHTSPEGDSAYERLLAQGIETQTTGENLALDFSAEEAHTHLMHSPPHRENILNPAYNRLGIGVAVNSEGILLVTEVFTD